MTDQNDFKLDENYKNGSLEKRKRLDKNEQNLSMLSQQKFDDDITPTNEDAFFSTNSAVSIE
jgi:hypothetical protein